MGTIDPVLPTENRRDSILNDQIDSAVSVLRNGGVVALPTDTLYGLAAPAVNESAVKRIYQIKGRDSRVPLPLLLAEKADFPKYAAAVPEIAWRLIERFMPGPLTIVLERALEVPAILSRGLDTIALRVPDHRVPREVARRLGVAITGTSANRSGEPGLTMSDEVWREFGRDVDLVVDGGDLQASVPSTVVDLTGRSPRIVRQGAVSRDDIEDTCEQKLVVARVVEM